MNFSEKAMELKKLRMELTDSLNKPSAFPVTCFVQDSEGTKLEEIEKAFLVFNPTDLGSDLSDAQLVRANIWKAEDCGMLYLESPSGSIALARINPEEQVDLTPGWITEKGEVIIRR